MTNLFQFNFTFPAFGMNNWFMPSWSFPNYFASFQIPTFNFYNSWFPSFSFNPYIPNITNQSIFMTPPVYSDRSKKVEKTDSNTNIDTFTKSLGKKYKTDNAILDDYNPSKGERLANIALNRAVGWKKQCATYVKSSIQAANLGSYVFGHAYQMTNILRNNKNFKEISPDIVDVSKLPAGCVLVYDRGTQGYSKQFGHTEITTGDGRAVSDGITKNLHKKPSAIFIPV